MSSPHASVAGEAWSADAIASLRQRGFCILRQFFPPELIDDVRHRLDVYFQNPAVAGSQGYSKVDYPKKVVLATLIGGRVLELLINETMIDIIETVMGSEAILAETFFKFDRGVNYSYLPMHSDFYVGWSKGPKHGFSLSAQDLQNAIGIGGVVYLERSHEGAFCYCDGTHELRAAKGGALWRYTPAEQRDILSRKVRCSGEPGDLVLFDARGFHGPDHPSRKDRLVLLLNFFAVGTLGYRTVTPHFLRSDTLRLDRLTPRQLRVLGVGAPYLFEPEEYTQARFRKSWAYPLIVKLIEWNFVPDGVRSRLSAIKRKTLKRFGLLTDHASAPRGGEYG